ncbi:Transcription initiation factor IIB [Apiospora arundinis]
MKQTNKNNNCNSFNITINTLNNTSINRTTQNITMSAPVNQGSCFSKGQSSGSGSGNAGGSGSGSSSTTAVGSGSGSSSTTAVN